MASDNTESEQASASTAPTTGKPPASNLPPLSSPSPVASPRNASPSRQKSLANPTSGQPSAAAIQRALSAANAPQLQSSTAGDAASKLPRPPKSTGASADGAPHWPTSPRLKSPPPESNSRRSSASTQKKAETGDTPSINVQSATPETSTPPPVKQGGEQAQKAAQLSTPVKAASRGVSGKSTLETVQENSTDDVKDAEQTAEPAVADSKHSAKVLDDDRQPSKPPTAPARVESLAQQADSGSESAGTKSPKRKEQTDNAQRPKNAQTKSYASLASTKSRQTEGKQNMTVETETVPSIPQSALSVGDRSGAARGENSGSVRQKPSSETIRPKKERKKTTQKPRSINQGTASSKADIFEQRVANAVDEANSSDSDETFVYESNPIEPRRPLHHSRTPSVASSHSVADQQRAGIRNMGEVLDERRVAGKRSMKFSNNAYNDGDMPDGKDGSVRSHTPRHFGRFGRGGSQQSMFDPDSPFTQASKLRSNQMNSRNSRPNSPRSPHNLHQQQQRASGLFGRKKEPSYDFDAEVGDDERTPLVGTVRTPRGARLSRRINRSPSIDEYYGVRRRSRCGRFGGCVLGLIVLLIVLCSTIAFLVMSNRPLYGVEILQIENVLASEQELMLDLWVSAVNPNALGIAVTNMDINIFAKSKHVGSGGSVVSSHPRFDSKRKRRRRLPSNEDAVDEESGIWLDLSHHWHAPAPIDGIDEGTDPPDDDLERDAQTMLLGRIFDFDTGLTFEGSPLKRHAHNSTGTLRLEKPGNKTESGGSERWERVLQNPFEIIIRGLLKYRLPISSRYQTVPIGASRMVDPEDVDDLRYWHLDGSEDFTDMRHMETNDAA